MTDALVQIDPSALEQAAADFGATETQVRGSIARATSRTTRWAKTRVIRIASDISGVGIRNLRKRTYLRVDRNGGQIWLGLNPVSLSFLRPRQTRRGVAAGKHFIPGAFIIPSGTVMKRTGKSRLPIKKQSLEIHHGVIRTIKARLFDGGQIERRWLQEFERDLQWRTTK